MKGFEEGGGMVQNPILGNYPWFSKIWTLPWSWVHLEIGDPPPISLYFSIILGVLRFAIQGPSLLWNGSLMISRSANRFFRNCSTSELFLGPPIFSIKIPVLALADVEACLPEIKIKSKRVRLLEVNMLRFSLFTCSKYEVKRLRGCIYVALKKIDWLWVITDKRNQLIQQKSKKIEEKNFRVKFLKMIYE